MSHVQRNCVGLGLLVAGLAVTPRTGMAQASMWTPLERGVAKNVAKQAGSAGKGVAETWIKNSPPLTADDAALDPDYNPPGSPQLPSLCKDSDECHKCFTEPYANLQKLRYRFEKLRRVYGAAKKMTERSLAFGDAAASGAGVGGLAWVPERLKIEDAVKNLQNSYDNKYQELIVGLQDALQGIGVCEEEVFGEESWYDRFGFIYYQFMADRYLRSD